MQIILRQNAGGFNAGDVLDIIELPLESQCLVAGTDRTAWVQTDEVLLMTDLYQRQPEDRFLTLSRISKEGILEWLQSPHEVTFGPRPFRFESMGEIVFFLRKSNHDCPRLILGRHTLTETKC